MSTSEAPPNLDYWRASSRPLASLLFVAPMLVAYELAMVVRGADSLRNGADDWLRRWLEGLGFGQFLLLPLLTCLLLLAWHHTTRDRWRVPGAVIPGMLAESGAFAVILVLLARAQLSLAEAFLGDDPQRVLALADASAAPSRWEWMLSYLGAGIYEELLFRMLLLPATFLMLRSAGVTVRASLAVAVVGTSLLFAAAHYEWQFSIGTWQVSIAGHPWNSQTFLFRFWAGAFFSLLFVYRGFGIAVGAHAFYDMLAIWF